MQDALEVKGKHRETMPWSPKMSSNSEKIKTRKIETGGL